MRVVLISQIIAATWVAAALLGPTPAGADTLAITYFDNHSTMPEYDPLGRGLADMLITDLSVVEGVTVVERSRLNELLTELELADTAFVDPATAAKMGRGLGAGKVLTGAFVAFDPQIRIDARLVDVATGAVDGSWEVTGDTQEFFLLEKELATAIVMSMDVSLTPRDNARMSRVATESFDAFVSWSQGLDALDRGELDEARRALEEALGHDSRFDEASEALAGLKERLVELRGKRQLLLDEEAQALLEMIRAAAEDRSGLDAALAQLSTYALTGSPWKEATANIEISKEVLDLGLEDSATLPQGALVGQPVNAWALGAYAMGCYYLGRWPEFLTYGEELLRRFPTSIASSTVNIMMPTVIDRLEARQKGRAQRPTLEATARASSLYRNCSNAPDPRPAIGWCREAIQARMDEGLPVEEYWYERWASEAERAGDIEELERLLELAPTVGPDLVDYVTRELEDAREDAIEADEAQAKLADADDAGDVVSVAGDLMRAGRQQAAYAAIDDGLQRWPDDGKLLKRAIEVAAYFGDMPRAEELLRSWQALGAAGRTTHSSVRVIDDLRKDLLKRDEAEPYRLHELGKQFQMAGMGSEAGDAYGKLAREYPEYSLMKAPDALTMSATSYLMFQDVIPAREAYEELLEKYPDSRQAQGAHSMLETLAR